jgi:GNAT superfamily N-acetyltransferase
MAPEVIIRKFRVSDRSAVRQLVHETALMGESAVLFFQGPEVITDALSLYFTDYEPGSCWVAEINAEIVGYLIGAKNKIAAEGIFNRQLALPLFLKAFKSGIFLKIKNIRFIISCLMDLISNGIKTPDFNQAYPATFHLNIKAAFRGQEIGTKLIQAYLGYLKAEGVLGVHLATMAEPAAHFFLAQGFTQLYKGKRSYFRSILHRDVVLYIFGKRL